MLKKVGKRGQVSIFVIIAIVIIAAVAGYFIFRGNLVNDNLPKEFAPVYSYYESCITYETQSALEIAGSQGGFVQLPNYEAGSAYAPFSNQLNFVGLDVPYWYYLTANGLIKENIPSMSSLEKGIGDYVSEHLSECDFSQFYEQGMEINSTNPVVSVKLDNKKVSVVVQSTLSVSNGNSSAKRDKHSVNVQTKIGKFYNLAKEIYNEERQTSFLENYTLDTLYSNAPVDGVEINCAPKIWKSREVSDNLLTALENNLGSIKFQGDYYDLRNKESKYFVVPKSVDEKVNLIYSKNWPTKVEINGDGVDSELMIAKSVGNQPGLGVMGFCYAPYHFVYDLSFPVMIQILNENELFQFPVAVVIDRNTPRQAPNSTIQETSDFDLCKYKNADINVNVYDNELNPIDGIISFQCFDQLCNLGETKNGIFNGAAPTCKNGYIIVDSEGYAQGKQLMSTNSENSADVILDKKFNVSIELTLDGKKFDNGNAVIIFNGVEGTSASIPDVKDVKLREGEYNISVYVYGNSSIVLPATKKTQCSNVPDSGILGFFGATEEKCYDIDIPETKLDYSLIGGGTIYTYLLPSDLEKGNMKIDVQSLPNPKNLDELSSNFALFSTRGGDISFS